MRQDFNPLAAPTRENYAAWIASRIERTKVAMKASNTITGAEIKQKNLSMSLLYNSGYKLDIETDTMVKQ